MGLLQTLGAGQGYLKAGFLGFPKSGKTFTATELAIGTRAFFNATGPIAFFDTEGGVEYVAKRIREATGQAPVGLKSRALSDLITIGRECEAGGVSVLIVDSVTHIWREVCDSALRELNERRSGRRMTRLEFQHWGPIKAKWAEWTDFYLNSKLHIVICGRAGFEYDYQATSNDPNAKKELVKTGVKMKTESEFGFEPSLLIEMDRVSSLDGPQKHHATILGDRFGLIDGRECDDPTFEFFRPHVEQLLPGAHTSIDTSSKTAVGLDEDGDGEWQRERRQRTIYAEEIQGVLVKHFPTQGGDDKAAKASALEEVFGTRSWTKISESTPAKTLAEGLRKLREKLEQAAPASS